MRWFWSSAVLVGAVGLTALHAAFLFGQTICGCPTCQANVSFYGHYPTRWRPWPGQTRPDIHFPQAIGAEPVPRPAGEKPPALPRERLEPVIPRPGQPFPEPPADTELNNMLPPETPPQPGQGTLPESSPPRQPLPEPATPPPAASPFQQESAPAPAAPSEPLTPAPGLPPSPPASPSPPAPLPGTGPSSALLPPGPELSYRPAYSGGNDTAPLNRGLDTRIVAGSGQWAVAPQPRSGGPVIVTNPTVVATPVPDRPAPESLAGNKLELPRTEWLPEVKPGASAPSRTPVVPQPASQETQPVASIGVPVTPPAPGALPAMVWAEDAPQTPAVAPVGYVGASTPPASASPPVSPATAAQIPPAPLPESVSDLAPPALGGFCPVELVENESWMKGDRRFAVEYQGRVYFCAGATQKRRFQNNPERYAPVLNGMDPVAYFDQGQPIDGKTEHCVVYDGRLYMFSSIQSLARFRQNPQRYAQLTLSVTR